VAQGVGEACAPGCERTTMTPVIGVQVPTHLDILERTGRNTIGARTRFHEQIDYQHTRAV
jgi:hypothetical protein